MRSNLLDAFRANEGIDVRNRLYIGAKTQWWAVQRHISWRSYASAHTSRMIYTSHSQPWRLLSIRDNRGEVIYILKCTNLHTNLPAKCLTLHTIHPTRMTLRNHSEGRQSGSWLLSRDFQDRKDTAWWTVSDWNSPAIQQSRNDFHYYIAQLLLPLDERSF